MTPASALLVTPSFLPGRGGIETYLAALCAELAPGLAVMAPARRGGEPLPRDLRYPTVPHPGRLLVPGPRTAAAICRAAELCGTERVLFGTPWPVGLAGPRIKRTGLRYAVIMHGAETLGPAAVPGLRRRFAQALSQADLLLPVSRFTASRVDALLARAGLKPPPSGLLRARVDLSRFSPDVPTDSVRQRFGLRDGDPVVLSFGRLVPRKGVDRLLRAAASVTASHPRLAVVIAGTGPEEGRLRRLASRLGVRAVFAGRVPDDDAAAVYASADVFVLPVADRWFGLEIEGLGVVLLEAAACGVPCVTGRSGGTPEAVVDGVTGFVVDGRRPEAVADRIRWLLDHPAEARAMGREGRSHVRREFSSAADEELRTWLGVR